ncbi:AHH domain-containing protein [Pseudomonadota bacterium]
MAIPITNTPYALKSKVGQAVDDFASKESPSQLDLENVNVIAQVEKGLLAYREKGKTMDVPTLENEDHLSARLAQYLEETGFDRPNEYCHAHAIVSGAHPEAAKARAVLAWCRMRIDDAHNGCWLPRTTAAKAFMPRHLRNAVPHSRIHRYNYYFWLNSRINLGMTPTFDKAAQTLGNGRDCATASGIPSLCYE